MAFPTIAATNTSVNSPATTSHTVNLPASISANDLLIVVFGVANMPTITTPSGWTLLRNVVERPGISETHQFSIFYKVASGSEGATLTITTGTSNRSAHVSYRITTATYTGSPEASTGTSAGTGDANPDSLTPSGGAKDYLWLAVGGLRSQTFSGVPTSYSTLVTAATSSQIAVGTGNRQLNATSEDPGTFSDSGDCEWTACTVSIAGTGSTTKRLALLGVG